jgi:probable phosphoglycerate mutase
MELYLLRHGESQANVVQVYASIEGNWPLSDEGRRQAEKQAARLKNRHLDAIFCSTLVRTRETADIVGQACGIIPVSSERLVEIGLGDLDGTSQKDPAANDAFQAVLACWDARESDARFPNGESLAEAAARVGDFLDNLSPDVGERVLIVGHSITLAAALWVLLQNPAERFKQIILKRGHLAIAERKPEGFHLVEMNAAP